MDSEFANVNHNTSGLLRFLSVPSTFLENYCDDEVVKNENNKRKKNTGSSSKFNLDASIDGGRLVSQTSVGLEESNKAMVNGFVALSSQLPPPYPRQSSGSQVVGSNNLMRQNSSPAGLFSHLNAQNGHGVGGYRLANGANGDMFTSSSRLKGQFSFPSGTPTSSLGMLTRISEVENECSITTSLDDEKSGNDNSEAQFYSSGLPFSSWSSGASHFQESFTGHKRELDHEVANVQIGLLGNQPPILSHHSSLPKTSADIAAMQKVLQLQDSVPCKIRAKRGCATHPRSVAERVRRTRISERMRKLQDLVPNMDTQTNTADMLDLAVEYIKDLQKQYKTLADCRANCKCSAMQKSVSNQRI